MKTEKERIYNALNVIKIFLSSVRFSQSIGKWNQSEFLKLAWLILARDNNMLNSCKCGNRMCYVFLFRNCTQLKFDRFFFDNRIKYSSSLNFNFNFFSCNDETFIKNSFKNSYYNEYKRWTKENTYRIITSCFRPEDSLILSDTSFWRPCIWRLSSTLPEYRFWTYCRFNRLWFHANVQINKQYTTISTSGSLSESSKWRLHWMSRNTKEHSTWDKRQI